MALSSSTEICVSYLLLLALGKRSIRFTTWIIAELRTAHATFRVEFCTSAGLELQ